MDAAGVTFTQVNLVVRDMDATVAFYRRLGLDVDASPGAPHVAIATPGGLLLEFDTAEFSQRWDSAGRGAQGGAAVIGFALPSRAAVDERYAELTGAGYREHQPPFDAFWGARYAIVDDPDGYPVGLMSPVDDARRVWPPPARPGAG